jgi:hypothetical protein
MTDIFDDIFDEAGALGDVDTQTGKTLSDLVRKLRTVEKEIEDAEAHIKALKQEKHKLSVENIPALMDEMGVERLDGGWRSRWPLGSGGLLPRAEDPHPPLHTQGLREGTL